jgi:ABC-2 type transport system permease protein
VPGILMMTVAAGSGTTAINVCTDMTGGIFDRFRTMAVSRGALLTGHVGGSVLRTLVSTTVVTGAALLAGFRPQASVADWLAVAGIVAAFSFALAWLSAALGLVAKSVAGANGSTLPIQFLLPFLSSAFVPAASMAAGVRWFTAHQPFTPVTECLRWSTTSRSAGPPTTRACPRWPIAPRGGWPTGTAGPEARSGQSRTRPSPSWSPRRSAYRRQPGTGSPRSPRST